MGISTAEKLYLVHQLQVQLNKSGAP